jgi:hypoxanthine phosphoribosyltransferase
MKQLLCSELIQNGVERLAQELQRDYGERPLTVIGVMNGSVVMLADLIRRLRMPLQVGVIQARSYRGRTTRPGELQVGEGRMPDIRGRDVLLLDDIFDTGHTLVGLLDRIRSLGPRSVRSAVLLRKVGRCEVEIAPDYVVFDIPDEFVVGYGLDYEDSYRHLPYIAVLEPSDLAGELETAVMN